VTATAPGFTPQANPIGTISNGGTVDQNFNLVTPHPFAIIGQVTGDYAPLSDPSDITVNPIAGATINASAPNQPNQTYSAQTDAQGNYSINNVNPGAYTGGYTVSVEAKRFEPQKTQVAQPIGASVTADFELSQVPSTTPPHPVKPGSMM
jgi:hypothetical protein